MRFGSSQHPEYATSSYRALRSYHSSFSIASVIGQKNYELTVMTQQVTVLAISRVSRRKCLSKPSFLLS